MDEIHLFFDPAELLRIVDTCLKSRHATRRNSLLRVGVRLQLA